MSKNKKVNVILVLLFLLPNLLEASKNIILLLADDQDVELGGLEPMVKTKSWMADQGITFQNAFVTTPICCPSRSSILTGRYQHNTQVFNNSLAGNCNGQQWRDVQEKDSFAARLKSAGYLTFYAGKYLNEYGANEDYTVPPGWDWWAGLVGNSRYYNYTLSINGKPKKFGDDYEQDYLTDEIGRRASQFFDKYFSMKNKPPFLMVLATPAPHAPFTPAPQYKDRFANKTAPRTPAFNYIELSDEQRKHWFVDTPPRPLPQDLIDKVDEAFRNRWRTLLSVDDLVDGVMKRLQSEHALDDTYILYTSDHGYHLGTFALTIDKRMPYETDLRVPLLVRGPGITGNTTSPTVTTNIDLAPTILEMAGLSSPADMDGSSFLSSCIEKTRSESESELRFLKSKKISAWNKYKKKVLVNQHSFLVEYSGEGGTGNDAGCSDLFDTSQMSECSTEWGCKCQDSSNNTYSCIRTFSPPTNTLFCMFEDDETFEEMYNIEQDKFQLYNLASQLSNDTASVFRNQIANLKTCAGKSECFQGIRKKFGTRILRKHSNP